MDMERERTIATFARYFDEDEDDVRASMLDPELSRLIEGVLETIRNALSKNTRRTYQSQWALWEAWADAHGASALPAAPLAVAAYLQSLANAGKAVSTIQVASTAISHRHREVGLPKPTAHPQVRLQMAGIARRFRRPQHQALPVDGEALAAIRATACTPRPGANRWKSLETEEAARKRGLLDIALLRSSCAALAQHLACRRRFGAFTHRKFKDGQTRSGENGRVHPTDDAGPIGDQTRGRRC